MKGKKFMKDVFDSVGDTNEAAKKWGVKPDTVKRYAAEGKIVAKKYGRFWLIDLTQPNPKTYKKQRD